MNRCWILIGILFNFVSFAFAQEPNFQALTQIAEKSLSKNIRKLDSGFMLTAGDGRLRGGFWARDFSFASRGLIAMGRLDVVKDTLNRFLDFVRENDGCVPRTLGSSENPITRFFVLYFGAKRPVPHEPLSAGYGGGGNGPETVDSNALLLIAAHQYFQESGDEVWWGEHLQQLIKMFRYYDHLLKEGLIEQENYADWQDGVKRVGPVLFSNLAYFHAMEILQKYPEFKITSEQIEKTRQIIFLRFYDLKEGIFVSMPGQIYSSLEDNLLALEWDFFKKDRARGQMLYRRLKKHPLWRLAGMPGFPTYPEYPDSWIGSHDKFMGLRHYHDSLMWSWLMGLSAKISFLMDDREESDRIFSVLEQIAIRDHMISEIYLPHAPYPRWSTFFNRSETDFAWGSGVILDALKVAKSTHSSLQF